MVLSLLSTKIINFCFFEKVGKSEFCTAIKHLHLKDLTPKEINVELYAVYGESAPALPSFTIGKMNLNRAAHQQKMSTFQDAWKK